MVAVAGCASTEMRAFTDPDFKGHTFKRLLISGRLEHLDQQAEAEDIFVKKFADLDVVCTRSLDVLLPTREFSDDEMFDVLRRNNIDAVLVLRETQYYEEQKYVPESSHTRTHGTLSANTYYHGNMAHTHGSMRATSYTHKSGGYYVSLPRVRHQLELYDVASKRVVWISGTFTRGNSLAGFNALVKSVADETVEALVKDGLVRKKGGN